VLFGSAQRGDSIFSRGSISIAVSLTDMGSLRI